MLTKEPTMKSTRVCPYCEGLTSQDLIFKEEAYKVRGETFEVSHSFYVCSTCGGEIDNLEAPDPLDEAYKLYRDKKGFVQPQKLIDFRNKYELTQKELSHMLGFGAVTLSRYENGALQSDAHNVALEMAMQPSSLLMLVKKNKGIFSTEKFEALLEQLDRECESIYCSSSNEIYRQLDHSGISEFSGYSKLQVNKIIELIVFMCSLSGALKTKLNKLMFYSDFIGFKKQTRSITGLHYVHLPYGPVPNNFDFVYAQLLKENIISKDEVCYPNGYVGENFISNREPDLSVFNEDELEVINFVREKFKDFTSTDITEYSHKEKAYLETSNKEAISYNYSKYIEAQ
tara:strand:- start:1622 stop:2650 length:1029 start_codon:yes stop_codon:yes gene_type:complete